MRTGVAISTTGHEHRIDLLIQSVGHWDKVLEPGDSLYVTVDGDMNDVARVEVALDDWTRSVGRVGRPRFPGDMDDQHRLGVAANKNTGLEYLMDYAHCDRLWLSDDDSWPLSPASLVAHYNIGLPHSTVNWGAYRRGVERAGIASWKWPRGSVMYVERRVVEEVGGFVEAFGHGGHEHVEWSTRIHNAGFTPVPFPSPKSYTYKQWLGAGDLWHCEDMQRVGESLPQVRRRRDKITSLNRPPGAEENSNRVMEQMRGSTAYVPYRADDNRRWSATMSGT